MAALIFLRQHKAGVLLKRRRAIPFSQEEIFFVKKPSSPILSAPSFLFSSQSIFYSSYSLLKDPSLFHRRLEPPYGSAQMVHMHPCPILRRRNFFCPRQWPAVQRLSGNRRRRTGHYAGTCHGGGLCSRSNSDSL